jgi:glycine/D-amino acid oxidase-like deaminating enzyme
MADYFGHHAVVIGGGLAGLMTARVLGDHFDTVTVLERDCIESESAAQGLIALLRFHGRPMPGRRYRERQRL